MALRHLAWSDERFFSQLGSLPDQALAARYSPGMWTVGQLLAHIVRGAEWYRYCLCSQLWTDIVEPVNAGDVERLGNMLADLDRFMLGQAALSDDVLVFDDEGGPSEASRSMLLSQAVLHAAEHKAQICAALEAEGFTAPDLDALDLWSFAAWVKTQ